MSTRRIAYLISILFHPLLLPTWAFLVILYIHPLTILTVNADAKWRLLVIVFILTFLAPVTGVLFFYTTGNMESLEMKSLQDRKLPFVVATVFYTVATLLFKFGEAFQKVPILAVILGSITLSVLLVTIISFYWKVSAHSTGISGVLGFLFGLSYRYADEGLFYPIIVCTIMAGLLMSARLYLNAHTPAQVLVGFLLGFFINLSSMILLL